MIDHRPLPPGTRVAKRSGKPFKSGAKIATVSGIIDHPELPGEIAFTFEEDDSYVRTCMCAIAEEMR